MTCQTLDPEIENVLDYVDVELHPYVTSIIERYMNRDLYYAVGRNRLTFVVDESYVIKIPTCADGCIDNDWESSIENTEETLGDHNWTQYARTRSVMFNGVPILFMEYVEHHSKAAIIAEVGHYPEWVDYIDSQQVGLNNKGRLVAYDYGRC